ncbi:MAG TPA: SagB/ThcOx family dehydrogenase [Phycisphaerae bacterium]|nr:SagB/ThcOx family dehydrogenase [Phycisphaerae bacterium]
MAPIGPEFMGKTRHEHLGVPDQQAGVPQPPLELPPDPAQPTRPLPDPTTVQAGPVELRELIERRRSVRQYAPAPLNLAELGYLLWCTQGVRGVVPGQATFRTVPSAGARHAFETYVLANRVEALPAGIYRYVATRHELATVSVAPDAASAVTRACFGQAFVMDSAATFLWSAVAVRMTWRYGQRGYRYLHLDAGHVCQNLYLAAESIGCGVCAVAAFDDDALNAVLGLDGAEQFVVYLAAAGRKP